MSDLTPETLAELRRLLTDWQEAVKPYGFRLMPPDEYYALAHAAVNALPALLDAAAERDRLAECVRAYGRTIDRWGLLIIAATHSEDITTPDSDGDWEVIESRLAEVPALLAERDALAATVERVRALHHEGAPFVRPGGQDRRCSCGGHWPCPTIRALDAGAES